jgi:transposase-like protein
MISGTPLEAVLGAEKSARVGTAPQGYRHGSRERTLTTSLGPATFAMPRARLEAEDGTTREWQRTTVARYQRRTARVDEALLGVYLSGTNTRRLKGALAPLLRGGPLSKDAVSRLVGGCATTSKRGEAGIWPTRISATSFWTAGFRRCASADGVSACRCW